MRYGWEIADDVQRFNRNTADIQFIEKSAYDALQARCEKLERALKETVKILDDGFDPYTGEGTDPGDALKIIYAALEHEK